MAWYLYIVSKHVNDIFRRMLAWLSPLLTEDSKNRIQSFYLCVKLEHNSLLIYTIKPTNTKIIQGGPKVGIR